MTDAFNNDIQIFSRDAFLKLFMDLTYMGFNRR